MEKDTENRMETITISPRDFISPPYITCPKCGKESFGVLIISSDQYCRRCKECLYPKGNEPTARYRLPKLNKKVIYIDQFAISNMMKALNPQTKAYKKGTMDAFWVRLFERLDSLCKLQLIICPDSDSHDDESIVSPFFKALKRMYELLSHGVSFHDHETIKRFQVYEHAKNWVTGNSEEELALNVHSVIRGNINAWQDRLIISVNMNYDQSWIDDLRKMRGKIHQGLNEVFKRWQSEKNNTFDDWFKEESMAFGKSALQIYLNYLKRFVEISSGQAELNDNDIFPPSAVILIHSIHDAFRGAGIQDPDMWQKTIEYLSDPSLQNIPFNQISSMLYAAIARKAAAGRKQPLNQGMNNDIATISALLPYCDAIFIDKECYGYLREKPLVDKINYGTKLFSLTNKEEFIEYLDGIEQAASREHLAKIDEVYGHSWKKPYTTLYK